MSKVKDSTQKTLESYNDIFADIANVYLFGGRQVIDPNDLEDATTESQYKFAGDTRSQDRDIAKHWQNGTIKISVIGFENQTDDDADMPLRIMGYDGAAYRDQIRRNDKPPRKDRRYPVVTIVLYFGTTPWTKPLSLKERLEIPEGLDDFVSDYRINLFEIAFLSDEQVAMFRSDFRIIADYCTQIRKTGQYTPREFPSKHPQDVFATLNALTGEKQFENIFEDLKEPRKGGVPMVPSIFKIKEEEWKAKAEEFKAKEEEFKARDEDLKARDEDLKARDEDLKARDEDLKARDEDLKARDEDLKARDEDLKARDEDLKARDEDLKARDEDLKARDEDLKARDEDLKNKEEALKTREADIRAKEEEGRLLYRILRDANRMDDYDHAMEDPEYKERLLVELGLKQEPDS